MKKFLSVLLALSLIVGVCIPAFADEPIEEPVEEVTETVETVEEAEEIPDLPEDLIDDWGETETEELPEEVEETVEEVEEAPEELPEEALTEDVEEIEVVDEPELEEVEEVEEADIEVFDEEEIVEDEVIFVEEGNLEAEEINARAEAEAEELDVAPVPAPYVPSPVYGAKGSKTATQLDANYQSNVTLTIPSAETQLNTDILFVLDKSSCSDVTATAAEAFLDDILEEIKDTGARVNIGALKFRSEVKETMAFTELTESSLSTLKSFVSKQPDGSGTNLHGALAAAQNMLNGSATPADRKYVIVFSDGNTYLWGENGAMGAAFKGTSAGNGGKVQPAALDANFNHGCSVYGMPENWVDYLSSEEMLTKIGRTLENKAAPWKDESDESKLILYDEREYYADTVDVAMYKALMAYDNLLGSAHVCVIASNPYPGYLGYSFMCELAERGESTTSLDNIQNDILYAVDKNSTIVDYMGYTDEYNFDFVAPVSLSVGDDVYTATQEGNTYSFDNGNYVLTYEPADDATEKFTLTFNVPVSNFVPVALTYTVELVNPNVTDGGKFGEYGYNNALFTNNSAVLYPVDTNGVEGTPFTFPMPTVSYVNYKVTKTWDDDNNHDGLRPDSVTVNLLANGEVSRTAELSEENDWTAVFTNVPEYPNYAADGEKIEYSLTEETVDGYEPDVTPDGYDFTVTNTHENEVVNVTVSKVWDDEDDADGIRPESIIVNLYADGAEEPIDEAELSAENEWTAAFNDLDKYNAGKVIAYTVEENKVDGYTATVTADKTDVYTFVITNKHEPAPTVTPAPTEEPTPVPVLPSDEPDDDIPSPTPEVTEEPDVTPEPTEDPTPEPTEEPDVTPEPLPSDEPDDDIPTPTPEVTEEPDVTPVPSENPTPVPPTTAPSTTPNPNKPQTGDNNNLVLWAAVMGVAVLGLAGIVIVRRRKSSK